MEDVVRFWCFTGQHFFEGKPDRIGKMKSGRKTFIKKCSEHHRDCFKIMKNDSI